MVTIPLWERHRSRSDIHRTGAENALEEKLEASNLRLLVVPPSRRRPSKERPGTERFVRRHQRQGPCSRSYQ